MENLSPEVQALITTIIYLDCRVDAILQILGERGIKLEPKDVHAVTLKIHAVQGEIKRYQIAQRIKEPNFDIG